MEYGDEDVDGILRGSADLLVLIAGRRADGHATGILEAEIDRNNFGASIGKR